MRLAVLAAALAAAAPAALAAATDAPPRRAARVAVKLFAFSPDTLRVPAGSAVTWVNGDETAHTVTAGEPDRRSGAFHRALPGAGAAATVTLGTPGTYPYHCDRHPFMRGAVVVTTTPTGEKP